MLAGTIVLLAAVGAGAHATVPLQVALVLHGAPAEHLVVKGTLHLVPVGGTGFAAAKGVDAPIEGPALAPVQLPGDLVWEVRTEAEGWWSKPVTVFVGATATQARVELWPACTVTGHVKVPERERPPEALTLRFRTTAPATVREGMLVLAEAEKEPFGDATCPVKAGRFQCLIAAGTLDLRAKAKGFVPHYLWAKKLPERGTLDLGTLALQPGSSVAGFVTTAEGPSDPKVCELSLRPLVAGAPPLAEMDRPSARIVKVGPDARGFFVFDGVAAGMYAIEARQPGFALAERAPVRVEERADTELPATIVLERPVTLTIEVRPATDARGAAWTITLFRPVPGKPNTIDKVFDEPLKVSLQGRVERQGVPPGSYEAVLTDSDGTTFLDEDFEVTPASQTLVLETNLVAVTGHVTLADKPLAADIYFGGRHGSRTANPMHSDEEGQYSGVVSREGKWTVAVEAANPPVKRQLRNVDVKVSPSLGKAEVDLSLPDNKLTGTVVDEDGKPVGKAHITLTNLDAADHETAASGDDGTFELSGLAPGHVAVSAWDDTPDGPRNSEETRLELKETGSAPDIKLVLVREVELEIHLVGEGGEPVAGALVWLWVDSAQDATFGSRSVTSDAAGVVKAHLPARVARVVAVVIPPGYAFRAVDVAVERGTPVTVVLSRYGGTLQVRFPPTADWSDRTELFVGWEDGAFVLGDLLVSWARTNGMSVGPRPTQVTIPQVTSGNYTLCLVPFDAILAGLKENSGGKASCDDGFLPTLGELTLTLSAPK